MASSYFSSMLPCAKCNLLFSDAQAKVVHRSKKREILHVVCIACKSATLLSVVKMGPGMQVVGIQTDCDYEDTKQWLKAEAVSVEDVLNVHQALKLDNFL